jgi:hypothetical protein
VKVIKPTLALETVVRVHFRGTASDIDRFQGGLAEAGVVPLSNVFWPNMEGRFICTVEQKDIAAVRRVARALRATEARRATKERRKR